MARELDYHSQGKVRGGFLYRLKPREFSERQVKCRAGRRRAAESTWLMLNSRLRPFERVGIVGGGGSYITDNTGLGLGADRFRAHGLQRYIPTAMGGARCTYSVVAVGRET